MAIGFSDLGEHIGTVVAILGFMAVICLGLIGSIYKIVFRVGENLKNDILAMIKGVDSKVGEVWEEIDKIRTRQDELREQLPKEYMRFDGPGYQALRDSLARIEAQIEKWFSSRVV